MQPTTALAGTARWLSVAVGCLIVVPVLADDTEDLNQAIQHFQEGDYSMNANPAIDTRAASRKTLPLPYVRTLWIGVCL